MLLRPSSPPRPTSVAVQAIGLDTGVDDVDVSADTGFLQGFSPGFIKAPVSVREDTFPLYSRRRGFLSSSVRDSGTPERVHGSTARLTPS